MRFFSWLRQGRKIQDRRHNRHTSVANKIARCRVTGLRATTLVRMLDLRDFATAADGIVLLAATCVDCAHAMGMSVGV